MFGNLWGKKSAQQQDDQVWKTAAACVKGLCRETVKSAGGGHSVIVVCLTMGAFETMDAVLAAQQPAHCRDRFGRDALRARLARAQAGAGSITIALCGSLPLDPVATSAAVEILVHGRNASRAADAAIKHFADQLGPQASIAFHLSLEDALLKPLLASSLPLFEKLGLAEDTALSHAMITRSIANVQAP